jgi:hypothetical protein
MGIVYLSDSSSPWQKTGPYSSTVLSSRAIQRGTAFAAIEPLLVIYLSRGQHMAARRQVDY